ncbi:MAG: peptidoglycan editing factor PgeF [Pseudomonadota bacterium]
MPAAGFNHGFFSRAGGVSKGIYASLNVGTSSDDAPDAVAENQQRCLDALGQRGGTLITCYQVHSPDVIVIDAPPTSRPRGDALVTREPGLTLGVLAADCMPVLLAEPDAHIIGAAHAGWRGALAGVIENTVDAMVRLGADPAKIKAALGPCLRQENFEVGLDLVDAFLRVDPKNDAFFAPGHAPEKRLCDLAGFGEAKLREKGVKDIARVGGCTLGAPDRYFSYRASRRANDPDYGRNLSAIVIS